MSLESGNSDWPSSIVHSPSLPPQPSPSQTMPETAPDPELLSSLGRLVRGLSALFWGLPIALVVCVQTAKGDWFDRFAGLPRSAIVQLLLGISPSLSVTALLFYGLGLLGRFQHQ